MSSFVRAVECVRGHLFLTTLSHTIPLNTTTDPGSVDLCGCPPFFCSTITYHTGLSQCFCIALQSSIHSCSLPFHTSLIVTTTSYVHPKKSKQVRTTRREILYTSSLQQQRREHRRGSRGGGGKGGHSDRNKYVRSTDTGKSDFTSNLQTQNASPQREKRTRPTAMANTGTVMHPSSQQACTRLWHTTHKQAEKRRKIKTTCTKCCAGRE